MTLPVVSVSLFRRVAAASVVAYALLVVTGGAVRLTDSGLGCPDWPNCTSQRLTAALAGHRGVEFGNRLVTVAVSVLSIVVFLAVFRLPTVRRDLRLLASGLVLGLVAQIVLGGLVVLFKLNPYLVALHFLLTFAVLADAIVLARRARTTGGPTRFVLGRELTICATLAIAVLGVLITLGTIVTGSGPHPGGADAKRIGIGFRDAAELHSTVALLTIGIVVGLWFGLRQVGAPAAVQRGARLLLEVLAIQGILGYTQYALHDNGVVVEIHLAGATAVWCTAVMFMLSLRTPTPTSADVRGTRHPEPEGAS